MWLSFAMQDLNSRILNVIILALLCNCSSQGKLTIFQPEKKMGSFQRRNLEGCFLSLMDRYFFYPTMFRNIVKWMEIFCINILAQNIENESIPIDLGNINHCMKYYSRTLKLKLWMLNNIIRKGEFWKTKTLVRFGCRIQGDLFVKLQWMDSVHVDLKRFGRLIKSGRKVGYA